MTDQPDANLAFDPNFILPPVVKPLEHELHRIEAAAHLVLWHCPHCTAKVESLAADGELPRALGVDHDEGCPDWQPK